MRNYNLKSYRSKPFRARISINRICKCRYFSTEQEAKDWFNDAIDWSATNSSQVNNSDTDKMV